MTGSSSSMVSTVSLFPRVKMVERFFRGTRVEKKPTKAKEQSLSRANMDKVLQRD